MVIAFFNRRRLQTIYRCQRRILFRSDPVGAQQSFYTRYVKIHHTVAGMRESSEISTKHSIAYIWPFKGGVIRV